MDSFVIDQANELLTKCVLNHPLTHEGVDPLAKKACEKFVWYDPFQITGGDLETAPTETTTMCFKPSGTELHKWITVKPSLLQNTGYVVFLQKGSFKWETLFLFILGISLLYLQKVCISWSELYLGQNQKRI